MEQLLQLLPSVKLIEKARVGSKIVTKHDEPKTPLQRIAESEHICEKTKTALQRHFEALNPFTLQKQMKRKIAAIMNKGNH